jgi:hypothetical protein
MKKLGFITLLAMVVAMVSAQAFAGFIDPGNQNHAVPEPSTLHLMGTAGAAALGALGFYNIFKK